MFISRSLPPPPPRSNLKLHSGVSTLKLRQFAANALSFFCSRTHLKTRVCACALVSSFGPLIVERRRAEEPKNGWMHTANEQQTTWQTKDTQTHVECAASCALHKSGEQHRRFTRAIAAGDVRACICGAVSQTIARLRTAARRAHNVRLRSRHKRMNESWHGAQFAGCVVKSRNIRANTSDEMLPRRPKQSRLVNQIRA